MDTRGALAAIDCGTNSTRLMVASADGVALERQLRITRLGEGVDATGVLSSDAIDRTVAVLGEYRAVMDHHGVTKARLVATSASRDAANGKEFLDEARLVTGVEPELLEGTEEGRLSLAGAVADLGPVRGPSLVVDIGGGSTELVAGTGPDDPLLDVVSLQLGCVRMTERFLRDDPPTADQLRGAEELVETELEAAVAAHPHLLAAHRLVGLAGTVSTLASLQQGLAHYEREFVHHAVLATGEVFDWYRTLAAEDHRARLGRAGMVPGREDVIVGGALILSAVLTRFGFDECLVSESDILDGLVASLR